MEIKDLKRGMYVNLRNGDMYKVLQFKQNNGCRIPQSCILYNEEKGDCFNIGNFTNDLLFANRRMSQFDITHVYDDEYDLLYRRNKSKKVHFTFDFEVYDNSNWDTQKLYAYIISKVCVHDIKFLNGTNQEFE